jgi:hypothetical protein
VSGVGGVSAFDDGIIALISQLGSITNKILDA